MGNALPATTDNAAAIYTHVRTPAFIDQLRAALPPNITPDHFARVTVTALMEDAIRQEDPAKQLVACDRSSLYQAVLKCAQDGLLPDGRQAAIVKRGKKAVYQPMVGGFRAIAAEYGWTIRAAAVFEADEFDFSTEPPALRHVPSLAAERGQIVAAYAVARHRDGRREQVVMDATQIAKRRAQATTDQVWVKWPAEMSEKTAVRDLFLDLPLDPNDKRIMRIAQASDPVTDLYGPAPDAIEGDASDLELAEGQPNEDAGGVPDFGSAETVNADLLAQVHAGIERLSPTMDGWRLEKVLADASRAFGRPVGALSDLTDDELAQIVRAMPPEVPS